jgi:large subunit ribosomal protein L24
MKIKLGDTVVVISGKDKNKTGEVLKTYTDENKISVKGVNIVTKNIKSKQSGEQGRQVKIEKPIDVSNVMLVCPITQKRTRIAYTGKGKDKRRVSIVAGKKVITDTHQDAKKKK